MQFYNKRSILFSFFIRYKWQSLLQFILGICTSILKILLPIAISKYFEMVFGSSSQKAVFLDFIPTEFIQTIPDFLLFFFVLVVIYGCFEFAELFGRNALSEIFIYRIRKILFQNQLYINHNTYDEKGTGRYLLRYSGDLSGILVFINKGVFQFFVDFSFLVLTLLVLLSIDFYIFLIVFGILFCSVLLLLISNLWLNKVSVKRRDLKSALLSFVSLHLRSILAIKSFNKERVVYKKYVKKVRKILFTSLQFHFVNGFIQTLSRSMVYLMLSAILVFVYITPNHSASTLVMVVLLIVTLLPIFRRTLLVYSIWEVGSISFEKLFNVINAEKETENESSLLQKLRGNSISVRNLSYGFDQNQVFDRINFDIKSKAITQISGRGKTTLAKLFLGIYRNYTGEIKIHKTEIQKVTNKALRKKITVVSTDWPLYGNRVVHAIANGANIERKNEAKRLLEAMQKNWAGGLDLDLSIGELGQKLTYNQIIALSFARALLAKRKIIILEISFEKLDTELKSFIITSLNKLKSTCTIIILQNDQSPQELILDDKILL